MKERKNRAHVDDNKTELEETLETFDCLVKAGKVRAIGCSNYRFSRLLLQAV
ncbi:aldo/keto reductase [Paenibacillus sp. FSL R7-0337]|uniref:aldo/keto reductase n=1 Tax=unclassified Paenibacillus TaxID=185978 RepID=UPI0021161542|nr:aldo/keto reductase [Paenibacillus sp. FSL R7-0337]